jgi:hypothetical protein
MAPPQVCEVTPTQFDCVPPLHDCATTFTQLFGVGGAALQTPGEIVPCAGNDGLVGSHQRMLSFS